MEQQDKYYTPDIQDIHWGYEYELAMTDPNPHEDGKVEWKKWRLESGDPFLGYRLDGFKKVLELGLKSIRTSYLTNEQIQSEGWGVEGVYPNDKILFIKKFEGEGKWRYELLYNNTALKITKFWTVWQTGKMLRETVFRGVCKSVNELRIIQKQVIEN